VANGFSMITRVPLARPDSPSMPIIEKNAAGGTARWYSRPWVADLLRSPLDGCFQLGAVTWFRHSERKPLLQAWPGWIVRLGDAELLDRISGMCAELIPLSVNDGGADPTMRYSRGSRPATCRWNSPGSSLRLARSPVAPNSTMTRLSGRGPALMPLSLTGSVLLLGALSAGRL
jgi:hypothetical protein